MLIAAAVAPPVAVARPHFEQQTVKLVALGRDRALVPGLQRVSAPFCRGAGRPASEPRLRVHPHTRARLPDARQQQLQSTPECHFRGRGGDT